MFFGLGCLSLPGFGGAGKILVFVTLHFWPFIFLALSHVATQYTMILLFLGDIVPCCSISCAFIYAHANTPLSHISQLQIYTSLPK